VQSRLALDQHQQTLVFRHGIVTHPLGHDPHLARAELDRALVQLDAHGSPQNVEELVLVVMAVPREHTLDFGHLDVIGIVHLADDTR
jgi:hypothetical protein